MNNGSLKKRIKVFGLLDSLTMVVLMSHYDYPDWATDNYTTVEEAKAAIDKEIA
jgi:hypothetical protein